MVKTWKRAALVAVLCLGALSSGCYGPFNATRRLHHWNGTFDGKWPQEGMFLVLSIIPVYGVCMLGDVLIFNSFEFWGAQNPVDPPTAAIPQNSEMDQVAAVVGLPYSVAFMAAPGVGP